MNCNFQSSVLKMLIDDLLRGDLESFFYHSRYALPELPKIKDIPIPEEILLMLPDYLGGLLMQYLLGEPPDKLAEDCPFGITVDTITDMAAHLAFMRNQCETLQEDFLFSNWGI